MSGHGGDDTFLGTVGEKVGESTVGFNIFSLHSFVHWADSWGVSRALILWTMYAALLWALSLEIPNLALFAFDWTIGTAPVWAPIVLLIGAFRIWVWYSQSLFLAGRKPVLLEMKVPRDIMKSPRAMEIALTNLWLSSGETTFYDRALKGQVRPYFALEIASFGGDVHFYIWCWSAQRALMEQAIYGQYPEVELFEVEDYASKFKLDPKKHWMFAADWRKEKHDKGGTYGDGGHFPGIDVYPLSTYVDYELDKDPKEELKVDPMSTILELLGSLQPQEQMWISLVFRRCGKYGILNTSDRDEEWRKKGKQEVDKLRVQAAVANKSTTGEVFEEAHYPAPDRPPQTRPSWMQTRLIESMERNLSKLPFEFIGHGVYITSGEIRSPFFTSLRWIWKPYGNPTYSSYLRPRRWHSVYDYPWQDFHGWRRNWRTPRLFLDCYRRRGGFYTPWVLPANVMSVEELATLWRPPSRTVQTPGLERIPATKAAPPSNLPK